MLPIFGDGDEEVCERRAHQVGDLRLVIHLQIEPLCTDWTKAFPPPSVATGMTGSASEVSFAAVGVDGRTSRPDLDAPSQ